MKKNVLLVEDDPALRMVMREVLKEDYIIDEADNGDDGIDKGLNNKNDLIILDYHLPKKDGMQVIEAVKQAHPGVPVIVLTGYLSPESEARFNQLGAARVFPKPFNYKKLLDTVRDLVSQDGSPASAHPHLATALPAPESSSPAAIESTLLHHSLSTLSNLAEKVEFLRSLSEKYWIEPKDLVAIRETARYLDAELRNYYGKMNERIFDCHDFCAPLLRHIDKPCFSGDN